MTNKLLIYVPLCILSVCTLGQSKKKLDSLKQLFSEHPEDTIGVEALNLLSQSLYGSDSDSSLRLAQKAEDISRRINYPRGLSHAYHNKGSNYSNRSQHDSALLYFEKSLTIKEELKDSIAITGSLNNIGGVYYYQGDFARALYYFQESLKLKVLLRGYDWRAASSLHNIGHIYNEQKDYERALAYFHQALEIRVKEKDFPGEASTLGAIGLVYLDQKNYSKALDFAKKSLERYDTLGLKCKSLVPTINVGLSFIGLDNPDSALFYLLSGYEDAVACKATNHIPDALLGMGLAYAKKGLIKVAEKKILKSYEIANQYDLKSGAQEAAGELYKLYKSSNRLNEALTYMEISRRLKEQLSNEELTKKITSMELNYLFEQERDSLNFQKQSELMVLEAKVEKQHTRQLIALISLLLIVVFSMMIYRNYQLKKVANENLKKKNEIQEENIRLEEQMAEKLRIESTKKTESLEASSNQLIQFNQRLADIALEIKESEMLKEQGLDRRIIKELEQLRNIDHQWDNMKVHFESVHPDFFEKLEHRFPQLSSNDYKIMAFLKMKLTNKEIALAQNITIQAVEQAKRRLKKKLGMEAYDSDIIDFVESQMV